MPTERGKCVDFYLRHGSRRAFPAMAAIFAVLTLAVSAGDAYAGGSQWWEGIVGHGGQLDRRRSNRPQKKQKIKIDDLRPGSVPWRSEESIDAILRAIHRYEKIANAGGWKQITSRRMIRPGDDDPRVPIVRDRLRATGDLPAVKSSFYYQSLAFDAKMVDAVAAFQKRHGLRPTRRIDRATIAAMNVTARERLTQLNNNLRRLRDLMAERIEERYILVNVAAYQLEAVERYTVERRHRVIVGKPGRDTPTIRATIKGLNFLPYWRVPQSVARKDLIPRLIKEPEYLKNEHIRAVLGSYDGESIAVDAIDWTQVDPTKIFFRQDPGPWNALGLVRIDMPNEHTVYMHDTPMKQLFSQARRAFSAGCVRVEGVVDLVDWIARYELGWEQPGRAKDVMDSGQKLDLELTRPIPVYFTYITAWGEPDGTVQFRNDIYDRDGSRVFAGETNPDEPPPPRQALAP